MTYREFEFHAQGLAISGHLYEPDYKPKASAVMITGGSVSAAELFGDWQEHLAGAGVVSLSFDARGKGASNGYWSTREAPEAPLFQINSQATRVADTISAMHYLRNWFNLKTNILVGASMGGDVAIHAAAQVLASNSTSVSGLIVKSPSAYHPEAHDIPYGEAFTELTTNHQEYPPSEAKNFEILRRLGIPVQLIVPAGEDVILPEIETEYRRVVEQDLKEGELVEVGDETTQHRYFSAEDATSRQAKHDTIKRSTEFILSLTAK